MYLRNFGQTEVISAFSCYFASATGWTFPKPPAIFATLPVRWLSFRTNSNLVVLLSISNGRTSAKSLAAQIRFVMQYRSLRGSLIGGQSKSQLYNFAHLSFANCFSFWLDVFFTSFRFDEYSFRLRSELA